MVIVSFDLLSGERSLARYLAVSYVAVPIFDTIGLKGKPSTSFDESL